MKSFLLFVLICVSLCGCSGLAKTVKQLKDDHADVDFEFNGWGTTVKFHRFNPPSVTNVLKAIAADVDGK